MPIIEHHGTALGKCDGAGTPSFFCPYRYARIAKRPLAFIASQWGMVKVALPGIPLWNDQEIVLYHGTLDVHVASIMQQVDLNVCRALTDFGRGFYTTTSLPQAQRWAQDLVLQTTGGVAAVVRFDVERNDLAQLDCLMFVRGAQHAVDYWSFVQYCRTIPGDHNRAHKSWYDLVAGPVTGSWKKQTIVPDGDQFSFHTDLATSVLDNSQKARVL